MNQCSRNSHYTYYHNCAIILTARSSYTLRVQEGGVTSEDVSATPEVLAVRLLQWTVSSASHTTHRVYSARSAGSLTDCIHGVIVPGLIFSLVSPSLTSLTLSGSRITQIFHAISTLCSLHSLVLRRLPYGAVNRALQRGLGQVTPVHVAGD